MKSHTAIRIRNRYIRPLFAPFEALWKALLDGIKTTLDNDLFKP